MQHESSHVFSDEPRGFLNVDDGVAKAQGPLAAVEAAHAFDVKQVVTCVDEVFCGDFNSAHASADTWPVRPLPEDVVTVEVTLVERVQYLGCADATVDGLHQLDAKAETVYLQRNRVITRGLLLPVDADVADDALDCDDGTRGDV